MADLQAVSVMRTYRNGGCPGTSPTVLNRQQLGTLLDMLLHESLNGQWWTRRGLLLDPQVRNEDLRAPRPFDATSLRCSCEPLVQCCKWQP